MAHIPTETQHNSDRDAAYCRALKALQKCPGWYEILLNASIGEREYFLIDTRAALNAALKLQSLGFVHYSYLFRGVLATPDGKAFLVWLDGTNQEIK